MDESLVTDKQVAAGKGLVADLADERFLFGVGTNMSLKMFL